MTASCEERGATGEKGDCEGKHDVHPEAKDSSVSSVITSSIPKVVGPAIVRLLTVIKNKTTKLFF